MKIAPSYMSKERLLKKAARRAQQRIEDHTRISTAFHPEKYNEIKDNIDSVARYACRHSLEIEFQPQRYKKDAPKMTVYRRSVKYVDPLDGVSDPYPYLGQDYVGSANLPEGISDKKSFMKAVRSEAAKLLYEDKK